MKNLSSYSNNGGRTHQLDPKSLLPKRLTWELVANVNVEKEGKRKKRNSSPASWSAGSSVIHL